jgi:hypothetical protein
VTLAWHFLSEDRHTGYSPRVLVETGQTLTHDGPLELCESGLHASVRAIDALQFAPGPIICRVKLGGEMKHDNDKSVARERTVLWMFDAANVLHEMACCSATAALLIAGVDDPRSWTAIEAKRAWLRGEIDDAQLAAAWDAARDAAGDAAGDAAWDAGRAAAWDATRAAAWDAARDAAGDAAWAAAWDAARAAAWDEQNVVFEALLFDEAQRLGMT